MIPAFRLRPVLSLICSVTFVAPEHAFALKALELFPMFVLEVIELVSVELVGSELARARLARVCLQVIGVKALCTAGLANQFRLLQRGVMVYLRLRPVLPLICCVTFAAPEYSFLGGGAINALELSSLFVLVEVENLVVEFFLSEFAGARLALVFLQVIRMKPLCTAGLADQHRPLTSEVTVAIRLRPELQLICCFTFAASELRLTLPALQTGFLSSFHFVQHVLVELEAAELLQAFLALVLVVPASRVSSLCTARAHEVSVESPMGSYHLTTPCASIEHVFAGRAPVVVGGQTILPSSVVLGTKLAS